MQVARKRIVDLEEEVARLKRELASRPPAIFHPSRPSVSGPLVDAVSPSLSRAGIGKVSVRAGLDRDQRGSHKPDQRGSTPRPATNDFGCAGPGRCRKLACAHGGIDGARR